MHTPPLWRKGGVSSRAHAPPYLDLELGKSHATSLRLPDGAEREDRVERGVRVHTYITLHPGAVIRSPANG
jgi:hypothetical protein